MPIYEVEIEWSLRTNGRQWVEVEAPSRSAAVSLVQGEPLKYFDQTEAEMDIEEGEYEFDISAEDCGDENESDEKEEEAK